MKKLIFILPLLISGLTRANEIPAESKIKEVIVYTRGAQIQRAAEVQSIPGTHTVLVKGLSPFVKANTVQVEGSKNLTILSVKYKKDFLDDLGGTSEQKKLVEEIKLVKEDLGLKKTQIGILEEEREFLKANRAIGGKDEPLDPGKFKEFEIYYRTRMKEIVMEIHTSQATITALNERLVKLQNQLNQLQGNRLPQGILEVKVHSKSSGKQDLMLRYQVDNAGWYPSYDLRFNGKNEPLQFTYKANIKQGTGVNWKNVKLKVSTAKTNVSTLVPELYPYYLDFYEPKAVYYQKSNAKRALESAAFGAAPEMALDAEEDYGNTQVIKKEIAVEFAVGGLQSLPSENKYEVMHLKDESVKAGFEHQAVPKLSPHIYLVGKISDWYDLNLTNGQVNIFMGNSFVGKSFINTAQFKDTIDVSFGVDRSVFGKREIDKDLTADALVGGTRKVTKAYLLSFHNQRKEKINLRVFDQIPISKNKDIQVVAQDLSGAKLNSRTGKLEWDLDLNPGQQKDFRLQYLIKYPKDREVLIGS